ncbi:MAG: alternative ribosome rescue aminoacyl-tRNA hydrolase ArfB [Legionellales bacterium]
MYKVLPNIFINPAEIKCTFICSPGPGGQHVNKVATAVLVRFNLKESLSFSESLRDRLLTVLEPRLTSQGELIIKAHTYRTQEHNKRDGIHRLIELIRNAAIPPKPRRKTKPTFASKLRRLDKKKQVAKTKSLRKGGIDERH